MGCEVKVRLVTEYEGAAAAFSASAAKLRRDIGTSTKEEYEQLGRFTDDARVKSEQARLALEQHTAEHRY